MQNRLLNIASTAVYVRMYMECALQINTYTILIKIKGKIQNNFLLISELHSCALIYRTQRTNTN